MANQAIGLFVARDRAAAPSVLRFREAASLVLHFLTNSQPYFDKERYAPGIGSPEPSRLL
jgi:hypothetical protein